MWHGTNVAVVVAILKTGLRIMPHSGGRVGKGIYLEIGSGGGFLKDEFHEVITSDILDIYKLLWMLKVMAVEHKINSNFVWNLFYIKVKTF